MKAPLQARNDSDTFQTDTARKIAQKRGLADNRPEAAAQRKLAEMMNNSPRMLQQRALSDAIQNSPRMVVQRHEMNALFGGVVKSQGGGAMPAEASLAQREERTNKTGLPNQLKSGIESLSGMSMDHVKVHYNSDKPAQLQAHAYAQGNEIHLGAGQERHLPHEAWHVVQQAQGRVRPTLQTKGGAVNDDPSLESEADRMGEKAAQFQGGHVSQNFVAGERVARRVTQRVINFADPTGSRPPARLPPDLIGGVIQAAFYLRDGDRYMYYARPAWLTLHKRVTNPDGTQAKHEGLDVYEEDYRGTLVKLTSLVAPDLAAPLIRIQSVGNDMNELLTQLRNLVGKTSAKDGWDNLIEILNTMWKTLQSGVFFAIGVLAVAATVEGLAEAYLDMPPLWLEILVTTIDALSIVYGMFMEYRWVRSDLPVLIALAPAVLNGYFLYKGISQLVLSLATHSPSLQIAAMPLSLLLEKFLRNIYMKKAELVSGGNVPNERTPLLQGAQNV